MNLGTGGASSVNLGDANEELGAANRDSMDEGTGKGDGGENEEVRTSVSFL